MKTPVESCSFPTDEGALRKLLSSEQYRIVRENGTERPFANAYWDNHEEGIYVDVVSGEPLFSSKDKFDSGTGWPSFTKPIEEDSIQTRVDESHGMSRLEARSKKADSHLGHVFSDGPGPEGLRYCVNSASLRFIPATKLLEEGYERFLPIFGLKENRSVGEGVVPRITETATFAAGCFWGVEEKFRKIPGVVATTVGYTGGHMNDPSYEDVCTDQTGHAEAVDIEFDPGIVSFEQLLDVFWNSHDPSTKNRQGLDIGTQYRSAIFYHSNEQRDAALRSKDKIQSSGKLSGSIVTEIVPAREFYRAEEYHQHYLANKGKEKCY